MFIGHPAVDSAMKACHCEKLESRWSCVFREEMIGSMVVTRALPGIRLQEVRLAAGEMYMFSQAGLES